MVNQFALPGTNEEFVLSPVNLMQTESNLSACDASPSWYTMGCNYVGWDAEVLSVRGTRTEELSVIEKSLSAVIASQRTLNNYRRTLRGNFLRAAVPFLTTANEKRRRVCFPPQRNAEEGTQFRT
eukprot:3591306-Amphidinium_carterae.1